MANDPMLERMREARQKLIDDGIAGADEKVALMATVHWLDSRGALRHDQVLKTQNDILKAIHAAMENNRPSRGRQAGMAGGVAAIVSGAVNGVAEGLRRLGGG